MRDTGKDELTGHPDWEAECKRITVTNCELREMLADLERKYRELHDEHQKMKAQLDIVHLIFGGR